MARPRSVVYGVESESRRSRIYRDWVTVPRHPHHLLETVLQRALRHAAIWQGGLPEARPPRTLRYAFATDQHTMTFTHVRNRRPATVRSTADGDVRPMSRLAALRGICSRIRCRPCSLSGVARVAPDTGKDRHRKGWALFDAVAPRAADAAGARAAVALLRRSAYPVAEL